MYDYLVVGSGLYGAVFAQQAKAAGNIRNAGMDVQPATGVFQILVYLNPDKISGQEESSC